MDLHRRFIEVSIRTAMDSGELLARLSAEAALGSWEKDGVLHIYWPEERWDPKVLEDLKRALSQLGIEYRNAGLAVEEVPDKDWNASWAASIQPIRLGRRIRIRQSWNPLDPAFDGIELIIDPKRAFGTGYHATTQFVIEWLEDRIRGGERVLDVGAGSGILAMAAVRLGAISALGIDIDPVAIECAREYAAVNGFGPELEFRTISFEEMDSCRFDLVVANLDGRTLLRLCAWLPEKLKEDGAA